MSPNDIITGPAETTPLVSFEFFPPKNDKMAGRLWESVSRLEPMAPDFVSVTYGAGGSTRDRTHETVRRMARETSLSPAAHLTCVSATKQDVLNVADAYWNGGVKHIVALRGDAPEGMGQKFEPHPDGFRDSIDLIEGLQKNAADKGQDFEISVSCYPESHPDSRGMADDIQFLKAKQDAGASRAITQFFYDPDIYLAFLERAQAGGVTMPIIPGIMLQPNFEGLKRIAKLCAASLPGWLHALYDGTENDGETRDLITANVAAELCQKLQNAGIQNFHFYTLNKAGLALSTCHLLGLKPQSSGAPQ